MDDIEKLIAGLPCPKVSPDLDERIRQATSSPLNARGVRDRKTRSFVVLVTSIACAGAVGFALGRQSVSPTPPVIDVATTTTSARLSDPATDDLTLVAKTTQIEAVKQFVMPPPQPEGLFGSGALNVRLPSHSNPQER